MAHKIFQYTGRLFLFIGLLIGTSQAGTLDDFESAKNPEKQSSTSSESNSTYEDDDDDSSLGDFFVELFFRAAWYTSLYGGQTSSERIALNPQMDGIQKRKHGEPLIPQYRFDSHYQQANSDITSKDFRFEYGQGPFGVQLRNTLMHESDENDDLRLSQIHALYRMSFGNHVGINMGIGVSQLVGNNRSTTLSFAFPIYFHPNKHFGFEIKTGMHFFDNAGILDLDYAALFRHKYFSLSMGYRELIKSGVDIAGPYAGIALHY